MTSHHHRSGPLKQKNKKHKTGRHESKTLLAKRQGGKIEGRRVSVRSNGSSIGSMSLSGQKAARLQRQKQLRGNKREDMLLQRRFGLGSALGPPKIVALVALSDQANLVEVQQSILEGASTVEEPSQDVVGLRNCTTGVFSQHKQKLCVVDCGCNLLVALDAAKVADVVVFVLAVYNGEEGGLSEEGVRIVSAVRAQGLPTTVGLIQGLEKHTAKEQNDLKKLGVKFFSTEFGENTKVAQSSVPGQLSRILITLTPKVIHWREARSYMLATTATFVPGSEAQNDKGEQVGDLQMNGYLRGKPLSVNQLVHITDVGTFQMSRITRAGARQVQRGKMDAGMSVKPPVAPVAAAQDDADLVLATADPAMQEDLRFEAEYDPFAAEQTWPTNEELAEAEQEAKKQRQAETAAGKGASGYQAAWLDGDDEDEDDMKDAEDEDEAEAVNQNFCKTGEGEDDDDDDDDMSMDDENFAEQMRTKRREEEDNLAFPDEVDVPVDTPARVRFARYRGMKSLRTSEWDPKESLPSDYARLFQFDDFAMVQRLALARGKVAERAMKDQLRRKTKAQQQASRSRASSMAMEDVENSASVASSSLASEALPDEFGEMGYVPSGVFVTLHLKSVPVAKLQARIQAGPLIMGALLKHENRLSVLNFSLQRASSFTGEPLKSKEELSFHCGFRRFSGKPIFSDQSLKSDQHLFQRFMPPSGWSVATVYAPVTFQPASVLLFKPDGQLVASGTLKNVNPDRVVLKRVVVTGTPVKVKKRKAVVRYMLHSPEDIRWFRPVELVTKHGLTGHIKESLGTHGDLKAIFNKPIKQHDTVCLHLYKRVYPKFPTIRPLSN